MNQHSLPPSQSVLPPELWFLILRHATYPPFPWPGTSSYSFTSSDVSDASDCSHQNITNLPFHIRLSNYASQLKWKASLTHVCKDWNLSGQQFLWEDLWIASAKDGRALAALICGKRGTEKGQEQSRHLGQGQAPLSPNAVVCKEKGFGLKRFRDRSDSTALPLATTHAQSTSSLPLSRRKNIASYIKKLYIETPSMDKCSPSDLILILERCERLEMFIDLRSVRSGFGFVDVGRAQPDCRMKAGKESAPVDPGPIRERHLFPRSRIPSASHPVLQVLLPPKTQQRPTLKHLTLTNYEHDPDDFQSGVWFWENVVGGALNGVEDTGPATTLESLEVVMSTRGVGMDCGYGYARSTLYSTLSIGPSRRLEAGALTLLDFDIGSSYNLPRSLTLPSLYSLRIPLTSPTLLVTTTWSLPSLQSLSVVSIDFTGWRRMGFQDFMEVHGGGLIRFEIVGGGESGEEEGWITEREDGIGHPTPNVHLPSTSPHLKHFICSTNASEWNWETPDWIAPHVLMPEHFGVERIGVWGLEGKVVRGEGGDYDGRGVTLGIGRRRRTISTWTSSRWSRFTSDDLPSIQDEDNQQHLLEEQPFFMLQEQFGSLLRREAFPSLVCIRDMSWESDLIRRSVGIGCSSEPDSSTKDPATTPSSKKKPKGLKALASLKETMASRFTKSPTPSPTTSTTQTQPQFEFQSQFYKIRKFWLGVLERCERRGVYFEDWMGRRVVA